MDSIHKMKLNETNEWMDGYEQNYLFFESVMRTFRLPSFHFLGRNAFIEIVSRVIQRKIYVNPFANETKHNKTISGRNVVCSGT